MYGAAETPFCMFLRSSEANNRDLKVSKKPVTFVIIIVLIFGWTLCYQRAYIQIYTSFILYDIYPIYTWHKKFLCVF